MYIIHRSTVLEVCESDPNPNPIRSDRIRIGFGLNFFLGSDRIGFCPYFLGSDRILFLFYQFGKSRTIKKALSLTKRPAKQCEVNLEKAEQSKKCKV